MEANMVTQTGAVVPAIPASAVSSTAAWVQFPRRVVLLLVAFGLTWPLSSLLRGVLSAGEGSRVDWSASWMLGKPVAALIAERLSSSLFLLGVALGLALPLALVAIFLARLAHRLEDNAGPVGSVIKGIGRLALYAQSAPPIFVTTSFLILVFFVDLRLLPSLGMGNPSDLGDRLRHALLPALALAVYPTVLMIQATARALDLPREKTGSRLWIGQVCGGLSVGAGQIGGILAAMTVLEISFGWPGIGQLMVTSTMQKDLPVVMGILGTFIPMVLAGRLVAELLRWADRLLGGEVIARTAPAKSWSGRARTIWVVLALALLLFPLGLAGVGLTVDPQKALAQDPPASFSPPSARHPWGADLLGRDVQARALRGGLMTLSTATAAAVVLLIPAGLGGALIGYLASRRRWLPETVADLLQLPADVLLLFPTVPSALAMALIVTRRSWLSAVLAVTLIILPRSVRAGRMLWASAGSGGSRLRRWLVGLGALFLGSLSASFALMATIEYFALGTPPPTPSLGLEAISAYPRMATMAGPMVIVNLLLWACAFCFHIASDALVGSFASKDALASWNE